MARLTLPLTELAVLLSVCVGLVHCGVWHSRGPCPEGMVKGQSWFPEDVECSKCTCTGEKGGYTCESCGVYALHLPQPGCYTVKQHPNHPYPACCLVMPRCPGDEGYDASKANPPNIIG